MLDDPSSCFIESADPRRFDDANVVPLNVRVFVSAAGNTAVKESFKLPRLDVAKNTGYVKVSPAAASQPDRRVDSSLYI